jgi:hypothetical protein
LTVASGKVVSSRHIAKIHLSQKRQPVVCLSGDGPKRQTLEASLTYAEEDQKGKKFDEEAENVGCVRERTLRSGPPTPLERSFSIFSPDFVLLSRRRQSCDELDTDVLIVGWKTEKRQAKGSVGHVSALLSCFRFTFLLPCHCAPVLCSPFITFPFHSRCLIVHASRRRNTGFLLSLQ